MPTFTPADLALTTKRSQRRVRDVLRSLYGVLPSGVTRWELTDEQAAAVLSAIGDEQEETAEWSLEPGDTVRRRQIHEAYGGQQQGGISTPVSIPDIFIFTDPVTGARYGYDKYEGLKDGSYWYTGEGQHGPQTFVRGNLAIRDSARSGKTLRLFVTKGTGATYVGAFTTGNPTYRIETIPDVDGVPREGIIFNLVPLNADERLLPNFGGGDNYVWVGEWVAPEFSDVVIPQPDESDLGERVVSRVEFELQSAFGEWLTKSGQAPMLLRLPVGSSRIEPDLYVPSKQWIVEAKKSSGRGYVREAIGQVLDYVHIAKRESIPGIPVILLPGRPEQDLVDLIEELGIVLAYRRDDGFAIVESD